MAAWSGGQLGLLYQSGSGPTLDLRHEHVSLGGVVTNDNVLAAALPAPAHAIAASDQGGVAATWLESGTMQYSFIASNGVASAGVTLATATPSTAAYGGASSVFVGGGTQLVAVGTGNPPTGAALVTLTATTGVSLANPIVLPGDRRAPLLARDNAHVAIAGGLPPYVQLLASDGTPTDNVLPMATMGQSVANNIVANPAGGFYTIWIESPDGVTLRLVLASITP